MDGRDFDALTKSLTSATRRQLLTMLTGGLLALLGVGATTTSGAAKKRCNDRGEGCDRSGDCCNDLICHQGECRRGRNNNNDNNRCSSRGERCDRDNDCCDDMDCRNRECSGDRDGDNNRCSQRGDDCNRDSDCCGNLECRGQECLP